MIANIYILRKYCDPESYKFNLTLEYFDRELFWDYFKQYWSIFLGWYYGYLGIEIPFILVGSTGDINFTAAWVVIFNICNIFWVAGSGIAMVPRTDVGIALGENNI